MKDFTRKNSDLVPMAQIPSTDTSFDTDSTESTSTSCTAEVDSFAVVAFCEQLYEDDIESSCNIRQRGTRSLLKVFDKEWTEVSANDRHRTYDRRNSKDTKSSRGNRRRPQTLGLLVGMSMILTLLAVPAIHRRFDFQRWKNAFEKEAQSVLNDIRNSQLGSTFTVVLKGRRLDLLKRAIDAHSQCSEVSEIHVEYQGDGGGFPHYLHRYGGGKVTQAGPISTSAAFVAEEGVIFSCEDLRNAFKIWKRDPRRLVSFPADKYSHNVPERSLSLPNHMNKGMPRHDSAFVHRRYLELAAPVTIPKSCTLRLLAVEVSTISNISPILVQASPRQIVRQSLQSGPTNGPADKETIHDQCLHHLVLFESMQRSSLKSLEATTVLGSR
jgi:Glycosyl transferase family 64 domain